MKRLIAITHCEGDLYRPPLGKDKIRKAAALFYEDGTVYDRVLRKHRKALHSPSEIIAAVCYNLLRSVAYDIQNDASGGM
jgi:hypothetical protein